MSLLRLSFWLIINIGFCFSILSQTVTNPFVNDKQKFEEIFDKEIKGYRADNASIKTMRYAQIPSWFFQIHPLRHNEAYVMGISDPGMEKEKAKKQAIARALITYTILDTPVIKSMNDYYLNEIKKNTTQYKYESFCNLHNTATLDTNNINILNTYFTKHKEYIIQAIISKDENKTVINDSFVLDISQITIDMNIENDYENQKAIFLNQEEYINDTLSTKQKFIFKNIGDKYYLESYFNEEKIDYPEYPLQYICEQTGQLDSATISYSTKQGLWSAFLQAITSQVFLLAENAQTVIKSIKDDYKKKDFEELNRFVTYHKASFYIKNITFDKHNLSIEILPK